MPNEIYLVQGETGEYEDYRRWTVCAYLDSGQADVHASLAQGRANEVKAGRARADRGEDEAAAEERYLEKNPYDPHFMMYSGGTAYRVIAVPVRGVAPVA